MTTLVLLIGAAWAGPGAPGQQAPGHRELVPEVRAASGWKEEGGWQRSGWLEVGEGTRAAVVVEGGPVSGVEVWAEGAGGGSSGGQGSGGRWIAAERTFGQPGRSIWIAELGGRRDRIQIRIPAGERLDGFRAEVLAPEWPEAGRLARRLTAQQGGRVPVLRSELSSIGVIDRATWGARATTCTSTEDTWYRMAIHHTAGAQTTSGSVQQQVQFLQAYSQDSGTYCDIPYQFLVGYDGTLWEARELTWYSGATYNNNDGNIAISFIGCYHSGDCPAGNNAVTQEMMDSGQRLVQELVGLYGIPSDSNSIRGHQDWPDNSTACPGDWLYARLGELREPWDVYAGTFLQQSFPPASEVVSLYTGESLDAWVELRNDGTVDWTPGQTFLATIPRDQPSALYDASWISPTRLATVAAVVPPGGTGRFSFRLTGSAPGQYLQYFGLVQEWVTWFADDGGPSDEFMAISVSVTDRPQDSDPGGDSAADSVPGGDNGGDSGGDNGGAGGLLLGLPGSRVELGGLGGCQVGGGGAGGLAVLAGLAGLAGARLRGRRRA